MDDLQFRRAIYADPNNLNADTIAALEQDASKKQFANDIALLDERIKQALQIPVPDYLCNKLILRQTLASHQVQKRKKRFHLALAASVAIVGGLMLNFMQFSSAYTNLGDYALAHVYYEEGSIANNANNQVSLTLLNKKMSAFDGNFSKSLGKLLVADYCRFDGMRSLHLVYQGITSPVNVFIVPKNEQLTFTSAFNDKQYYGNALGFNDSNIIVVGDKNESIGQWKKNISETVAWSI